MCTQTHILWTEANTGAYLCSRVNDHLPRNSETISDASGCTLFNSEAPNENLAFSAGSRIGLLIKKYLVLTLGRLEL